jgi:kinesin family protein 2/24
LLILSITKDYSWQEMRLLTEMDQPGSRVDRYVSQLSYLLSRKAAGIVNLQTQLARFQRHLKEQEVMSQYR